MKKKEQHVPSNTKRSSAMVFGSLRFFHCVAQAGLELSIYLLQIQVCTTLPCFLLSRLKCLSFMFKLKLGI